MRNFEEGAPALEGAAMPHFTGRESWRSGLDGGAAAGFVGGGGRQGRCAKGLGHVVGVGGLL